MKVAHNGLLLSKFHTFFFQTANLQSTFEQPKWTMHNKIG